MESVSLIDAVYSARLVTAGLPALSNVETAQTGVAPASEPYTASSTLAQLSGYGQLLSAASRTSDGMTSLLGASTNLASGYSSTVLSASASSSATAGTYAVNVTQVAKSQTLESGFFVDPAEQVLSAGTFSIAVGGGDPVSVTIGEGSGLIGGVSYPWGSLNGIVSAINSASAGVTASVQSGSSGYSLKLQTNATGAANTITLSAGEDSPFNAFGVNFASLGLVQTQASQDAQYTIGGIAGTSASNTGISLTSGATFDINSTLTPPGSTTVTISSTPVVAADLTSVTTAATKLVQNYNALQGTITQLTASGALSGSDPVASALSSALSTKIAELGEGTRIQTDGSGSLTLLTGGLSAGDASLLTSVATDLHTILSSYLGDVSSSGSILYQAKSVVPNLVLINNLAATSNSDYNNLSGDVKHYLQLKSLDSASAPTGLPESVFT